MPPQVAIAETAELQYNDEANYISHSKNKVASECVCVCVINFACVGKMVVYL